MLFNSIEFFLFLPVVFFFYWIVFKDKLKYQNKVILISSYIFYGWWDWRFLGLIVFSSLADYFLAQKIFSEKRDSIRRVLLSTSVLVNIGTLVYFKYFNFFIENFVAAYTFFGSKPEISGLSIILPVGISFYTFQTLSYTIDVYKKKLKPTNKLIPFMSFVCFFPQLVAGPIERASNLLPQFFEKKKFSFYQAFEGSKQVVWGLFKKVVIADNCGIYSDLFFSNPSDFQGSSLLLGAFLFTFQIYCDFSGYSDIAIGISRIFGFKLMQNFAFPYFSRDIAEFWRRWHISLSTWFRDYIYIPIGGSRGSKKKIVFNVFVVFIISGFWHGANWTFIFWGALNALFFLPLLLMNKNRQHLEVAATNKILPDVKEVSKIVLTFCLVMFTWVFFRADSLGLAFNYLSGIFSTSLLSIPDFIGRFHAFQLIIIIFIFILIEWIGRKGKYALDKIEIRFLKKNQLIIFYLLIFSILVFGNFDSNEFIYFQF